MAQLTAQQRNIMFQQATRQNRQNIGTKKITGGQQDIEFEIPKARYLARLTAIVKATVNIKHATKTEVPTDFFTMSRLIQRVSLDLNNGFMPFLIDGCGLKILSLIGTNSKIYMDESDPMGVNYLPKLKASSTGVDNEFHFLVELPLTLNERDPIGLILLQNNSALVNLKFSIGSPSNFLTDNEYEVEYKDIIVNVQAETYSVPASEECHPNLTTLKLIQNSTHTFAGAGKNEIQLGTGYIYRKLALQFLDEDGKPFEDEDFLSNIELVFNTSDCNYSVTPQMLRYESQKNYGVILPKGVYIFDFGYQGTPNLGGSRDLIDTETLTDFTLRFNSNKAGKVNVIKEAITRLSPQ